MEETVGEIIKKARITFGLTQAQLANQCGLMQIEISRIENNQIEPSKFQLASLNNVLNIKD